MKANLAVAKNRIFKPTSRTAGLLLLVSIAGVAAAQSDQPWDGFYAGLNAGGAWSTSCNSGTPNAGLVDPAAVTVQFNRNCPNGTFVGGAQVGDNFQYKRLVWGVGIDLDTSSASDSSQTLKHTGAMPPAGTYTLSGKLSPNGFAVIGPRMGYAGDLWLPYIRVGTVVAAGSHNSTLTFTPAGATKPVASFNGGKNFASNGWAAGGGTEIGLNGAWSITAEYLHVSLDSSDFTSNCNGSPSDCAAFSGISLYSTHNRFTANIFRIGINYWFGYWNP